MSEPTKQRAGDQVLPDGDESVVDDQQLIIEDIEARRQVGIERYGQGHRPFNGRDTLQDMYEEQLDLLVYLRSIKRMTEASRGELVEVISKELCGNGFQQIVGDAMADVILTRLNGWIAGQMMDVSDEDTVKHLRAALEDFRDYGVRADLNPSIGGLIKHPDDVPGWYGYLNGIDKRVRERAAHALEVAGG